MPLVTAVSDKMIALELGTVVTEGRPSDVIRHPQVVASYLGDNQAAVSRSGSLTGTAVRKMVRKATKAPARKTPVKPAAAAKRKSASVKRGGVVKRTAKTTDAGAASRSALARKRAARTEPAG